VDKAVQSKHLFIATSDDNNSDNLQEAKIGQAFPNLSLHINISLKKFQISPESSGNIPLYFSDSKPNRNIHPK